MPLEVDPGRLQHKMYGGRRSHADSEFIVRTSHRVEDIKRILSSSGPLYKMGVEGLGPSVKIDGLMHRLGPVTYQPPQVHCGSIDLDVADSRVRLRRTSSWRDKLQKNSHDEDSNDLRPRAQGYLSSALPCSRRACFNVSCGRAPNAHGGASRHRPRL